jgi:hypothetical protein
MKKTRPEGDGVERRDALINNGICTGQNRKMLKVLKDDKEKEEKIKNAQKGGRANTHDARNAMLDLLRTRGIKIGTLQSVEIVVGVKCV